MVILTRHGSFNKARGVRWLYVSKCEFICFRDYFFWRCANYFLSQAARGSTSNDPEIIEIDDDDDEPMDDEEDIDANEQDDEDMEEEEEVEEYEEDEEYNDSVEETNGINGGSESLLDLGPFQNGHSTAYLSIYWLR